MWHKNIWKRHLILLHVQDRPVMGNGIILVLIHLGGFQLNYKHCMIAFYSISMQQLSLPELLKESLTDETMLVQKSHLKVMYETQSVGFNI